VRLHGPEDRAFSECWASEEPEGTHTVMANIQLQTLVKLIETDKCKALKLVQRAHKQWESYSVNTQEQLERLALCFRWP